MPKCKIRVSILSEEEKNIEEVEAILDEENLKYKEEKGSIVVFNLKENKLVRDNKEFKMKYFFDEKQETDGIIEMKEMLKEIPIKIKTKKIERKDKDIKIDYYIEDNLFTYQIEALK